VRRALVCLGLANLLLLGEWDSVHTVYRADQAYFTDRAFSLTYFTSTATAVVLLAAALLSSAALLEVLWARLPSRVSERLRIAIVGSLLIASWISASAGFIAVPRRLSVTLGLLAGVTMLLVHPPSRRRSSQMLASTALGVLVSSAALLPIFVGTILTSAMRYPLPAPAPSRDATGSAPRPDGQRLLWILFDEMDVRVAFDRRPSAVALSAFDRLRRESLVASNAYAPGQWTLDAFPTLWTGRPVSEAVEDGPSDLRLTFVGEQGPRRFDPETSLFAKAAARGHRVGLAGWYHPYCRLFGRFVDRCTSEALVNAVIPFERAAFAEEHGLPAMVARLLLWHAPWSPAAITSGGFTRARHQVHQPLVVRQRVASYQKIHRTVLEMIRDPTLALVFAHYPVPHLPGLYDPVSRETDTSGRFGYLDNLALADRTLGEVRRALEDAGLWATTAVLVQSDHGLRPELWTVRHEWSADLESLTGGTDSPLVPFILKLPSGAEAATYDKPFRTVLAHDLALELLDGRLSSPPEVSAWLDTRRLDVPLTWPVRTLGDRE